jgi:hypothetical protein
MFELTTSNLDQELREQKIAEGLRRRALLEANVQAAATPQTTTTASTRTAGPKAAAGLGTRAAAQR